MDGTPRPYHHGSLRQDVIEAAVAEVEAFGAGHLSMRRIARRAGVSHAAPAHHFGDKAGIYTAVAAEGFRLLAEAFEPARRRPDAFLRAGMAYLGFAIAHRGHFEVMFRPDLYRASDPDVAAARNAAFQVLYEVSGAELPAERSDDVPGLAVASWAITHGFASLWLHAGLREHLGSDLPTIALKMLDGVVALGDVTRRQLRAGYGRDLARSLDSVVPMKKSSRSSSRSSRGRASRASRDGPAPTRTRTRRVAHDPGRRA